MLNDLVSNQVCEKPIACFTAKALNEATYHWSQNHFLGGGGFGEVYRGQMPADGTSVAVKRLRCSLDDVAQQDQFHREVVMSAAHDSLVSVIGYCATAPTIVFELMEGGTLQ